MNTEKSISVSSLGTFLNCPRKFFYSHEMRWIPATEADALTFGKAWHSWLEYYGKSGGGKPYSELLSQYLTENEQELTECLKEDALDMFLAMALEFENAAGSIGKVTETETKFSFRIPSTAWRIDGIIDAVHESGCPIEYKTTSSTIEAGDFYWIRLKANLQALVYAVATDANKVHYIVARKPRIQRKQVPLLDERGLKIVTNIETGERAMNANGSPRQTAGQGLKIETRTETREEFIERLRSDLQASTSYNIVKMDVDNEAKCLAIETLIAGVRQIEMLRKRAKKASRPDIPFIRNCTEWNCKNCPYQGICLDVNVNPNLGIPNGFITK